MRNLELEAALNYLWQKTGNPEEDAASHATLGATWLADRHWRISLSGRWDSEILKADEAHPDLFNRIDLTIAYEPVDGT